MIIRAHALALPLRDACVDLIVTSPPYFALRSYRDGGEHYADQIGAEETPGAFVDALIDATREMVRVLKPTGSIFVNLGDKYAGSGGHNNAGVSDKSTLKHDGRPRPRPVTDRELELRRLSATRRNAPDRYNQNSDGIPAKSLMGLPWRYANACVDRLGLILRRDLIWHKPNGLPESVTDRCRSSHEYWFHFVKQGHYFSAVDELREPTQGRPGLTWSERKERDNGTDTRARYSDQNGHGGSAGMADHAFGRLPGSVWTIATEPLMVPEWARETYGLPDHFAAFPQEWPRRLILGWSPPGICTKCGEGRRPVVEYTPEYATLRGAGSDWNGDRRAAGSGYDGNGDRRSGAAGIRPNAERTIIGYGCGCDVAIAPTRPAIVLDPFGGTGTVAMVARALGRIGLNGDLSGDYCRLARWRVYESGHAAKSEDRTWRDAQGVML